MNAQPLNFVPASEFKQRASDALADAHLRKSFRGAMDFLINKRAAQFPDPSCPNPINECANSSWYVWTVSFAALPAPFDATSSNTFEITEMLASEPVVEEL